MNNYSEKNTKRSNMTLVGKAQQSKQHSRALVGGVSRQTCVDCLVQPRQLVDLLSIKAWAGHHNCKLHELWSSSLVLALATTDTVSNKIRQPPFHQSMAGRNAFSSGIKCTNADACIKCGWAGPAQGIASNQTVLPRWQRVCMCQLWHAEHCQGQSGNTITDSHPNQMLSSHLGACRHNPALKLRAAAS